MTPKIDAFSKNFRKLQNMIKNYGKNSKVRSFIYKCQFSDQKISGKYNWKLARQKLTRQGLTHFQVLGTIKMRQSLAKSSEWIKFISVLNSMYFSDIIWFHFRNKIQRISFVCCKNALIKRYLRSSVITLKLFLFRSNS